MVNTVWRTGETSNELWAPRRPAERWRNKDVVRNCSGLPLGWSKPAPTLPAFDALLSSKVSGHPSICLVIRGKHAWQRWRRQYQSNRRAHCSSHHVWSSCYRFTVSGQRTGRKFARRWGDCHRGSLSKLRTQVHRGRRQRSWHRTTRLRRNCTQTLHVETIVF